MMPTIEERLRDELVDAAGLILAPADLVANVNRRLRRRNRRRGVVATVAALVGIALIAAVATAPRSPHAASAGRPHPRRTLQPGPQIISPSVVHGPALIDTTTGRTVRAIRTVTLPGGRSPLQSIAAGDVLYADSALTDGRDFSQYQRLVRVDGRTGRVVMSSAMMRSPTAPYLAFGLVWVGDANRLLGLNPNTLVVRRALVLPGDLAGQITAAGGYLWVAGWTHLDRVDPHSGALTQIAPRSSNERYAGLAANGTGSMLFAAIKKLPEITTNVGSVARLSPTTGSVITSANLAGVNSVLAGITGTSLWMRADHPGLLGQIDKLNTSSLALDSPFGADNSIDVSVSNGVPWVGADGLGGTTKHGSLFVCANPATGVAVGSLSLRRFPGRAYDGLPANTSAPHFLAAGRHEIFATVNEDLVVYHADPACAP
jgi:hypothetical protein